MSIPAEKQNSNLPVCLIMTALSAFLVGLVIDIFFTPGDRFLGVRWYGKFYSEPYFAGLYLLKLGLSIVSALGLLFSVLASRGAGDFAVVLGRFQKSLVAGVWALSASLTALCLSSISHGSEDGYIEWLSAIFLLLASVVFIYILAVLRCRRVQYKFMHLVAAAGFAVVFFVIAMEELSWLQRVLEIDASLPGNEQGELNFHNLQTGLFCHAYNFGTFVFFILMPFINSLANWFKRLPFVEFFIPSRFIMLVAAPLFAHNFFLWNSQVTQLCFFTTVFILGWHSWDSRAQLGVFIWPAAVACGVVMTQAVFLWNAPIIVQYWSWDVTEYMEFLIAFGFLAYSMEMLRKVRQLMDGQANWDLLPGDEQEQIVKHA